MLDLVEATRFDRMMTKGRTSPLMLAAEKADRSEVELIAKFSAGDGIGVGGLVREAIAALLAVDLGLPVQEPFLVEVSNDFIKQVALTDASSAKLLADSAPCGFGSRRLPNGFSAWMPRQTATKAQAQQALEIFAFDAWIQNTDRYKSDNPNLQFRGDDLAIFDHDLAFITEGIVFWRPPWEAGSLIDWAQPERHVLLTSIKGRSCDLARLVGAWQAISDTRLGEYRMAIPPQWAQAMGTADHALQLIAGIRENIGLCVQEVQRVLV